MKNTWVYVFCLISVTVGTMNLAALYWWSPVLHLDNLSNLPKEALEIARSLGRLDLVSFWLSVLGFFLAVFAIIGYGVVRVEARKVSTEEAREVSTEVAKKTAERVAKAEFEQWRNRQGSERSSPGEEGRPGESVSEAGKKRELKNKGENQNDNE